MIINRSPFRISFAGGGSDLPDFFKENRGAVISTTINKYIYISLHPNFDSETILLKYSKTERVKRPEQIKNDIAKSILSQMSISGLELDTVGDVPAKTGLGSSSAFAVGLHQILNTYKGKKLTPKELAQMACKTEIEDLKHPIGKQDQYASAYGGLNLYQFFQDGRVSVQPIKINTKKKKELEQNLLLFYTGIKRSANSILKEHKNNLNTVPKVVASTKMMTKITYEMKDALEKGDLKKFAELLSRGWELKQSLASTITNKKIDTYYKKGLANGALGGKLLGAGGGGFLLFYCEKKNQSGLRKALSKLHELKFSFTSQGAEIIFQG